MIIKDHGMGWIIEPTTSDEAQALGKLVEGLRFITQSRPVVGGSTGQPVTMGERPGTSTDPTMAAKG